MPTIQRAKLIYIPKGVIQLYFRRVVNIGIKLYSRLSVRRKTMNDFRSFKKGT